MKRRYHLHLPGLLYVVLTVVVGFAAINNQNNVLFWILGVMLSALVISGLVSGMMMSSLQIRRLLPAHGLVGEPLMIRYALSNRSRFFPVFNVHIEERAVRSRSGWNTMMDWVGAWVMHVGPRETVHGEATFWPRRRGKAEFGSLRIWTTFPFGIIKKSITITRPQHVLIYPQMYELRRGVLKAVTPQGLLGATVSRHTGAGDDYFGMREFRPGDSMRQIAWKRSAALDQLVSIERTTPAPPKVRIVVNLTRATHELERGANADETARDLEESAISLAASLIQLADLNGYEVGLSLPGTDLPSIQVRRNVWHREKLMAALASIDLDAARKPRTPQSTVNPEQIGRVVVHPDRVEASLGGPNAWHVTARQLKNLAVRPIGWDAARTRADAPSNDTEVKPKKREAAA